MSVLNLTDEAFDQAIKEGTVLVDFFATWCGPCKKLSTVIDEIAEEAPSGVKVIKIDIDQNEELVKRYRIMSVPTLMVFRNGEIVNKTVGLQSKQDILALIRG